MSNAQVTTPAVSGELQDTIALAVKRAFDAGRRYENSLVWEAVDMCDQTSDCGNTYVYLDDLKEHIDELNQKREGKL